MASRRAGSSLADTAAASSPDPELLTGPGSRSPGGGAPASEAAAAGAQTFGHFRDWCLRTYGDSGKTKTVTRRKYNKIVQTLLQEDEERSGALLLQENHVTAKFKFWVKSKGFRVGTLRDAEPGAPDTPVLYVPIKATVSAPLCSEQLFPCQWVRTGQSRSGVP